MAGRNRMPRHPDSFRGLPDDPRPILRRGPLPPHPLALEEELDLQRRDIQRLLVENRHVIDDNVMLQRDLASVKDEIHRLSQVIPKLHGEREAQRRELIERGLKLEAELRASEPLREKVAQLRTEAQKLSGVRNDLSTQVQNLTKDVNKLQAENKQLIVMKTDVEKMRKELADARRIYEHEKKENEELVEQNLSMEQNLISMAREMEKLRAEQSRMEMGIRGYGMLNGSHETRYPGPYSDTWGSYDKHGPFRR
ncbi:protein FLX-like 3 [Primulina huaijiensis]|uniref:protein FLX-like 3 n=1 Tax=Primulina huaijiensis TaxID=1492673 RepID=UPI003CC71B9A